MNTELPGNSLDVLEISPTVRAAQAAGKPVVGFETTVLSFGLPYPANVKMAQNVERMVSELGCCPATMGILDNRIRVGLSEQEIRLFCQMEDIVTKVNLQNLSAVLQRKTLGAFTVAASMQACSLAGIRVFSTGGIGGVHRDYAESHDVSSDLIAMARYPVAVVCAGIKSILDIPATLERLESLGVPIIGYRTNTFPLFHVGTSNIPVEVNTDSIAEVADIASTHWKLGGKGVLVVTPVPAEYAIDMHELESWIAGANRAAKIGRVSGKAVTPFLLKKMDELSQGRTNTSNVALLENNARTAAELATALDTGNPAGNN